MPAIVSKSGFSHNELKRRNNLGLRIAEAGSTLRYQSLRGLFLFLRQIP
jgi:hypothetical protein